MKNIDTGIMSQEVKEKYFIDNNTFIGTVKENQKHRIDVEVGDRKQSDFKPQIKLLAWDNDVNFSVRLVDDETEEPVISTYEDKIVWQKPKKAINFYDMSPSESFPEGAYEFEIILNEKPSTNKIEFTLQTKGLEFYYQPPLTSEYSIDNSVSLVTETHVYDTNNIAIAYRPDNVIGSYAVYYKDCPRNIEGGKEYRAGKAFHIYRPRIEDSVGNWVWGNLHISDGLMTVVIPQDFLDTAVYPVKHAAGATFGYTTSGGSLDTLEYTDRLIGCTSIFNDTGVVQSISAMIYNQGGNSYPSNLRVGLFLQSNLNLIAQSNIGACSSTNWIWKTLNLSTNPSLTQGETYLIAMAHRSNNYNSVSNKYDTVTGYTSYRKDVNYVSGGLPNPLVSPTTTANKRYSIYATYSVSASVPAISIQSYTKSKISGVATMTTSTVVFRSDVDCDQWEARADGSGNGQGLLVVSGGAITANTDISFDVVNTELTNGDKSYRINVYGHNAAGWSPYG